MSSACDNEHHTSLIKRQFLRIELRGESKIGPLVRLLVQAGAEVEEVRRGKASLEDVFLTLMEEEST